MGAYKEMMLRRKAQVEAGVFQQLVIGIVLITGLVVLSVQLIGSINLSYNSDIETSNIASLSQYNRINDTIGDFESKIQGNDDSQPESTNIIDLIVTAGYGTIKLMFAVPEILTLMINDAAQSLGVPSITIWMLSSIVLIIVIFAAFAVIMKVRA